jgi:thiamine transport system permease protein
VRYGGRYSMLWMLPMLVSSVTLGWAFIASFLSTPLYGSWVLIVIAHSVISFPLVFRSVWNSYSTMDRNQVDAARTLGASPLIAFLTVELPQLMPGILVGATFAFAISLGEFGATLLLYRPEYTTIPIAIYKILGTRAFGSAAAMATILMLIATASFLLIERMGGRQERSAF